MKYLITKEKLKKVVYLYLDKYLKDLTFTQNYEYSDGGGKWVGFVNPNSELIVGYPSHDSEMWFYDGTILGGSWEIFGISPKEFNNFFIDYIFDNYSVKIPNLS